MFITPITGLRRQPSKMSIRQTLALLAGLAALKALPVAGEEYRTLARLTDLFKRDPSRAAALVATAREGSRAINQSDAQRSPNLPGGSNLPALVDGVLVYDVVLTRPEKRLTILAISDEMYFRRGQTVPGTENRGWRGTNRGWQTAETLPSKTTPALWEGKKLRAGAPVPHLFVPTDRQRPSTSGPSRSLARVASLAWRFAKVHTGSRTERRSPGTQAAAEPGRNYTTKWPCGWDHISPHNRHAVGSRRRSSCSS